MTRQLISLGILSSTFVFGQTLTPRELFNKFPARPAVATPDKKPPQPAISAPGMNNASIAKPGKQPTAPNTHNSTVATLVAYSPLGLRYSLLHSSEGASYSEVDADTVFRSGDKLKVTAQSNDPAHLYVTGTGLTHLGSASTRDAMHKSNQAATEAPLTDSMKLASLFFLSVAIGGICAMPS